ncbi:hypothetical protein REPUB_Repub04eG0252400 [Reevesia pubescens]
MDEMGTSSIRNSLHDHESKFDAAELLCNLEARYNEIDNAYGGVKCLSKTMSSYLQFCQDVGSEPAEDVRERRMSANDIMYEMNKMVTDNECHSSPPHDGRTSHEDFSLQRNSDVDHSSITSKEHENSEPSNKVSAETSKKRAIRLMKKNMEEIRFFYILPRVKLKRLDYLHYVRKRDEGAMTYVAHADYYILLRSCARVAEIDMRIMHVGVLSMERRLPWLEQRINHCLHLTPSSTCKFCTDESQQVTDDPTIGLSNLNL